MKDCVDYFIGWVPFFRRSDSATLRDAVKVDVETLRNEIRELVTFFHIMYLDLLHCYRVCQGFRLKN